MPVTTFSSRQFNQDTGTAKKAAQSGPVFITDRGKPAHVLLTFEAYEKLTKSPIGISELLGMPEAADIEFPEIRHRELPSAADFS